VTLVKNKYGLFVIQKAITRLSMREKNDLREYLLKNVIASGGKEKTKFISIIDCLGQN
jgi:hypothetical protein